MVHDIIDAASDEQLMHCSLAGTFSDHERMAQTGIRFEDEHYFGTKMLAECMK